MVVSTPQDPPASTREFRPSLALRLAATAAASYQRVFANSPLAPLLSRPKPVRRTGFELNLVIDEVTEQSDDVLSLRLREPDGRALPRWVPGAHVDVVLPSGRQRQYSLCGDPAERTAYRIAVRRIDHGFGGSREIHELRAGDPLTVRGPRNAFRLVRAESYLFIAGGIGITPILPMVQACHRRGAAWRLVYLGRSRASMPLLDELAEYTTGEVDIRGDDEFGAPDIASILRGAAEGAAVYLCGPNALMAPARGLLRERNPTASLHTEHFSAPPVARGESFEVRLNRSGITVGVGAQESALAAIRREVPDVAYSCQQGFCGTCKQRVLAGDVEHRDQLLSPRQRQDSMLICVSRSAGGSLTLDL